jgi:hypothetical protein
MKKILTSLCLIFAAGSFAQVSELAKISDIATFRNAINSTLIVRDTMRGGIFNLYTGNNPVDNGIIIIDA